MLLKQSEFSASVRQTFTHIYKHIFSVYVDSLPCVYSAPAFSHAGNICQILK